MEKDRYYVNGDCSEKVGRFSVWSVEVNGEMVCSFYGPQAAFAAGIYARAMNKAKGEIPITLEEIQGLRLEYKDEESVEL